MDGSRDAVAGTGVLVAAIRARESRRPDRLFDEAEPAFSAFMRSLSA